MAATGYWEETVARYFESPIDPRPSAEVLRELYDTHQPEQIGLGFGGSRGMTRSLTHDSYQFLAEAMGSEAAGRFVSAEALIDEYRHSDPGGVRRLYRPRSAHRDDYESGALQ